MSKNTQSILVWILGLITFIGLLKVGYLFVFELSGAWNSDSSVYFAMGRGIVNGFLPYRDLFEIKPPGIFLVSALSYFLGGNMTLGHVLQGVAILLVPLSILYPVWIWTKTMPPLRRWVIVLASCVFGLLLAVYNDLEAGWFQTESFGACFAAFAVMLIACDDGKISRMRVVLTALFLLAAVSFKEPFILAPFAAALLFSTHPRDLVRTFFLPALLAGVLFAVLMQLAGVLQGYIGSYLYFMSHSYLHRHGAMGLRGFSLWETLSDHWVFSPFFALAILSLWIGIFILRTRDTYTKKQTTAMLQCSASLLVLFALLNLTARTPILSFTPVTAMFFGGLVLASIALFFRSVPILLSANHSRFLAFWRLFSAWLALYVSLLAAGVSGDFFTHHFVCEMPIYIALFLLLIRAVIASPTHVFTRRIGLCVIISASLALLLRPLTSFQKDLAPMLAFEQVLQTDADTIDAIMDRCGWERYLFVSSVPKLFVFGFTRHSPQGPVFTVFGYNTHFAQFHASYLQNLRQAQILITTRDRQDKETLEAKYIEAHFTTTPPSCAMGLSTTISDLLLFRKT